MNSSYCSVSINIRFFEGTFNEPEVLKDSVFTSRGVLKGGLNRKFL